MEDRIQKLIVRQTCVKAVVELFKGTRIYDTAILENRKVKEKTILDMIDIAKTFEQYVYSGDMVSKERMKELNDIVSDIVAKGEKEKLKENKK